MTCQRLTADQAEILTKGYICIKCAHPNGRFDYDSSLSRLEAAGKKSLEALHSVTKLESILLRDDQLTGGSEEVEFRGEEDVISKEIISRYRFGKNISLNMFFTRRYYYMVDCTTANAVIIHVNLCNNIQKNITRL